MSYGEKNFAFLESAIGSREVSDGKITVMFDGNPEVDIGLSNHEV